MARMRYQVPLLTATRLDGLCPCVGFYPYGFRPWLVPLTNKPAFTFAVCHNRNLLPT
jgi:hypothetical protein